MNLYECYESKRVIRENPRSLNLRIVIQVRIYEIGIGWEGEPETKVLTLKPLLAVLISVNYFIKFLQRVFSL